MRNCPPPIELPKGQMGNVVRIPGSIATFFALTFPMSDSARVIMIKTAAWPLVADARSPQPSSAGRVFTCHGRMMLHEGAEIDGRGH
jgi:hypothetical protein